MTDRSHLAYRAAEDALRTDLRALGATEEIINRAVSAMDDAWRAGQDNMRPDRFSPEEIRAAWATFGVTYGDDHSPHLF